MKQEEKLRTVAKIKTQDYKNWAQLQPLHKTQLQNPYDAINTFQGKVPA